jgi:hypothetical protein
MTTGNTNLTPKQRAMLAAAAGAPAETPAPAAPADATEPADAVKDETEPAEGGTATKPVDETLPELTDVILVEGRINTRSDGERQGRYNLRVINVDGIEMLQRLGEYDSDRSFDPMNDQGQCYVSVSMDNRSQVKLINGTKGNPQAVVTGILTVSPDPVNGKPSGHFELKTAKAASFLQGGTAVTRERREPGTAAPVTALAGGLRSSRR